MGKLLVTASAQVYRLFLSRTEIRECIWSKSIYLLLKNIANMYKQLTAKRNEQLNMYKNNINYKIEEKNPENIQYCRRAHTANWVTEASQSPVPACGTTFHQDYDGGTVIWHFQTISENLLVWRPKRIVTPHRIYMRYTKNSCLYVIKKSTWHKRLVTLFTSDHWELIVVITCITLRILLQNEVLRRYQVY